MTLLLNFEIIQITKLTNRTGSTKLLFKSNKSYGLLNHKFINYLISDNINDDNQEQSKI